MSLKLTRAPGLCVRTTQSCHISQPLRCAGETTLISLLLWVACQKAANQCSHRYADNAQHKAVSGGWCRFVQRFVLCIFLHGVHSSCSILVLSVLMYTNTANAYLLRWASTEAYINAGNK